MSHNTIITVNRKSTKEKREQALRRIYQQVLERQPFYSERINLSTLERNFLTNKVGVRRFLKELGCSDLYLDAFYYHSSNPKFLETCFKHFLGRSIQDGEEMRVYCNILVSSGVKDLICSILDSEEYRKHFGCFTVPYYRNENHYESPNVYLETNVVRHEHYGRRGWSIPTLYWHQLGIVCDYGVCGYPDASVSSAIAATTALPMPDESNAVIVLPAVSTPPTATTIPTHLSEAPEPLEHGEDDELAALLWGSSA